jgi:hypothetical protein
MFCQHMGSPSVRQWGVKFLKFNFIPQNTVSVRAFSF